jgi:hypothetical protein
MASLRRAWCEEDLPAGTSGRGKIFPLGADAFHTAAVMIKEPEKKKEHEKRRPAGKLSPWSCGVKVASSEDPIHFQPILFWLHSGYLGIRVKTIWRLLPI